MRVTADDHVDQGTLRGHDPVDAQSAVAENYNDVHSLLLESSGFVVDRLHFVQELELLGIREQLGKKKEKYLDKAAFDERRAAPRE